MARGNSVIKIIISFLLALLMAFALSSCSSGEMSTPLPPTTPDESHVTTPLETFSTPTTTPPLPYTPSETNFSKPTLETLYTPTEGFNVPVEIYGEMMNGHDNLVSFGNEGIGNKRLKELVDNGEIPKDVRALNLELNGIYELAPLKTLSNLQYLNLSWNMISDLWYIQYGTELRVLILNYNHITEISFLKSLADLEILNLSHNHVSELEPLESLTKLQLLDLSWNQINDLMPLASLSGLQYLILDNRTEVPNALREALPNCKIIIEETPMSWEGGPYPPADDYPPYPSQYYANHS